MTIVPLQMTGSSLCFALSRTERTKRFQMLAGSKAPHWFLHWLFVERVTCGNVLGIEMKFYTAAPVVRHALPLRSSGVEIGIHI
jgi:hypothetical protein